MSDIVLTDAISDVGVVDVPKFAVPFAVNQVGNRLGAAVVRQDSPQEIAQCVYAILATEVGQREELPEFGMADQAFLEGGVQLDVLRDAVSSWEPRAQYLADADLAAIVQRVRVTLS